MLAWNRFGQRELPIEIALRQVHEVIDNDDIPQGHANVTI